MTATTWQTTVDQWNNDHPVGTCVMLMRCNHPPIATTTRSHAYIQPGVGPVILLKGVIGAFLLHYVHPLPQSPSPEGGARCALPESGGVAGTAFLPSSSERPDHA